MRLRYSIIYIQAYKCALCNEVHAEGFIHLHLLYHRLFYIQTILFSLDLLTLLPPSKFTRN